MSQEPIFRRDGDAYVPTAHARGPWDAGSLHGGAPAALLAGVVEQADPGADMAVARVTFEFLAPVPLAPLHADARVVRPGRRLQLVEGELRHADRVVLLARAVRLRRAAAGGETTREPLTGDPPEASLPSPFPASEGAEGFHRTGMELRFANGTDYGIGTAQTWFRFARALVGGEEPTPLQRVVAAADFGNGVARALDFDSWLFVNTDLTVHVDREPQGEWVQLDAQTTIGPQGTGLATSVLSDRCGRIGVAAQSLFVEPR